MKTFRVSYQLLGESRGLIVHADRYSRIGSEIVFTRGQIGDADENWVAAFPCVETSAITTLTDHRSPITES